MPITLTNPAGLWALLAIPVILLIHFLQRQSVVMPVSTLFLLEKLQQESVQGRNFDKIKNSIPLWLQLLTALIFTWILTSPRWERSDSVQRIAIVIDTSASMRAFTKDAAVAIQDEFPSIIGAASIVELTLLESHETGKTLYHGTSLQELLDTLEEWKPGRPGHDPNAALRIGRSLAGENGVLIFLTDHKTIDPGYGGKLLAVGAPLENVGFAGITVDEDEGYPRWKVIVRNYGTAVAERQWILTAGGRKTDPRKISLEAGKAVTLEGRFPKDTRRILLQLEPDSFDLDDQIPVIIPAPKPLTISRIDSDGLIDVFGDILDTLDNAEAPPSDSVADLTLYPYSPVSPTSHDETGIVMIDQGEIPRDFHKGPIVATNHPLVNGLNWQGLIARLSPSIPFDNDDTPLVWQGEHPLVFLRETSDEKVLHFNFDIPSSNAVRLPAFIVLIHRFIESIRTEKIAEESLNFELGQIVDVAHETGQNSPPLLVKSEGREETINLNRSRFLRADDETGFFTISQGDQTLINGASHFADTREADLTQASSFSELGGVSESVIEKQSAPDRHWQIWMIIALLALMFAWLHQRQLVPQQS